MASTRGVPDLTRLLRLAVDASGEAIFMTDREGVFTFVNTRFETLYGYAAEALVGRATPRVIKSGLVPSSGYASFWRQLLGAPSVEYEFVNRTSDGRLVHIEATVSPIRDEAGVLAGFLAIQRDITERRHAEERQRVSDRRLEVAVNSADMALFAQDRSLRYTWLHNPQLGVTPDEVLGRTDHEILPAAVADHLTTIKQRALDRDERVRDEVVVDDGGQRRVFELFVEPVRDLAGVSEGITGASLDITVRRQLEDRLRQAQKLEAIGGLAGGIAHDFNNLLTAIIGYAELAGMSLPPDSQAAADLEEIARASRSAEALTRQLLIFSRKTIVQPVPLRLDDIVIRLDKMLRRMVGEHIAFDVRLGEPEGVVKADAGQIEQVLMNLVVNARDAMPTGGTITIVTGTTVLDRALGSGRRQVVPGVFHTLMVSDTGHGMTPEVQAQMFDPFFTTKGPEKGTGLGLATVQGIVQQAGGYIIVQSAPGAGATFTVCFPRADAPAAAPVVTAVAAGPAGGGETVLLVEDDDGIRHVAVRGLEHYGYHVIGARDAEEAMHKVRGHAAPVDLLVTDVVMPGVSGRELAARLRAAHPRARVVFTSGFSHDSDLMRGIRTEVAPLVHKPFTIEALARTVRQVLDAGRPVP